MTYEKIKRALVQANNFINRAFEALDEENRISGTKRSGALRRASMDLTRALAELRKS